MTISFKGVHGTDMIGQLLGKRQRCADQPCNALPQRVVKAFDGMGFARQLADRFGLRRWRALPVLGAAAHTSPEASQAYCSTNAHIEAPSAEALHCRSCCVSAEERPGDVGRNLLGGERYRQGRLSLPMAMQAR